MDKTIDQKFKNLYRQYRQLRLSRKILFQWGKGKKEGEKYKWDLLKSTHDKSLLEIVKAAFATNLVDERRDYQLVVKLIETAPTDLDAILEKLVDEQVDLHTRLANYKKELKQLIKDLHLTTNNGAEYRSFANDERSAAAILSCKYPQKYTFYKDRQLYGSLCNYLGIKPESTGAKYEHFLQLLKQYLVPLIAQDSELHSFVRNETDTDFNSDLLIAQDILWVMFNYDDAKNSTNMDNQIYQPYKKLLEANKNLILTGAPGTGKTFMAHKIAEAMGATAECIKMVQFHPSYDYTDFVEGLRPNKESNGFEYKAGVFKEFCKKALQNLKESEPETNALRKERAIRQAIDTLAVDLIDQELKLEKAKNIFSVVGSDEKRIHISIPNNDVVKNMKLRKSELVQLYNSNQKIETVKDVRGVLQRKYGAQDDSYLLVLYKLLKKEPIKEIDEVQTTRKNFVFIIDEINRGEISKIFGELFFSIDPGYRGKKEWKVNTQYQNLLDDDDDFYEGFFIPENVYIIGTMNDIDRSVESMDFAMRRRFAWKEVTAEESFLHIFTENTNLKENLKAQSAEIEKRMTSLNALIADELGVEYQIGAAYFLKLKDNDYESLWNNHLKGLIYEYFRGEQKEIVKEKMNLMKEAFDGKHTSDNTNDGQ